MKRSEAQLEVLANVVALQPHTLDCVAAAWYRAGIAIKFAKRGDQLTALRAISGGLALVAQISDDETRANTYHMLRATLDKVRDCHVLPERACA